MTDQERLGAMRWMRREWEQHIASLTPEQADQLAKQDIQRVLAQTQQTERACLTDEMTMRANANRYYKAAIDRAALARLAAALEQTRASETGSESTLRAAKASCA